MYFEIGPLWEQNARVQSGIDIRITEKDGNLPLDCLFCTGIAKFQVSDGRPKWPIIQIRICESSACCAKAFSYILQVGYGYSAEGSCVPDNAYSPLE